VYIFSSTATPFYIPNRAIFAVGSAGAIAVECGRGSGLPGISSSPFMRSWFNALHLQVSFDSDYYVLNHSTKSQKKCKANACVKKIYNGKSYLNQVLSSLFWNNSHNEKFRMRTAAGFFVSIYFYSYWFPNQIFAPPASI
jgi:hypothetical protein